MRYTLPQYENMDYLYFPDPTGVCIMILAVKYFIPNQVTRCLLLTRTHAACARAAAYVSVYAAKCYPTCRPLVRFKDAARDWPCAHGNIK